jgi:hypothetical protein
MDKFILFIFTNVAYCSSIAVQYSGISTTCNLNWVRIFIRVQNLQLRNLILNQQIYDFNIPTFLFQGRFLKESPLAKRYIMVIFLHHNYYSIWDHLRRPVINNTMRLNKIFTFQNSLIWICLSSEERELSGHDGIWFRILLKKKRLLIM